MTYCLVAILPLMFLYEFLLFAAQGTSDLVLDLLRLEIDFIVNSAALGKKIQSVGPFQSLSRA